LLVSFDSAISGAAIGSLTLIRSDGFTGGAVIFFYLMAGFFIGLIAGMVLMRYLNESKLKILNIILGIIAIAYFTFLAVRIIQLN